MVHRKSLFFLRKNGKGDEEEGIVVGIVGIMEDVVDFVVVDEKEKEGGEGGGGGGGEEEEIADDDVMIEEIEDANGGEEGQPRSQSIQTSQERERTVFKTCVKNTRYHQT